MPGTPLPNCVLLLSVTTPAPVPKVTGTISLKSRAGRVYRIGFRYPTGCLPASLASWFASATSAANWGEEALVPPTTCQPTRAPGKLVKTSTPPSTAAFQERSGTPRRPSNTDNEIPDWNAGVAKRALRAPPVAAGSQSSFHTASVRPIPVVKLRKEAAHVPNGLVIKQSKNVVADTVGLHRQPNCNQVPPADVTRGSDEGQFAVGKWKTRPCLSMFAVPESPLEPMTVTWLTTAC